MSDTLLKVFSLLPASNYFQVFLIITIMIITITKLLGSKFYLLSIWMKSAEVAIVNKEGWLHSLLNVFFKTDVFVSFFGLDYKCMHNVEQLSVRAEKSTKSLHGCFRPVPSLVLQLRPKFYQVSRNRFL